MMSDVDSALHKKDKENPFYKTKIRTASAVDRVLLIRIPSKIF